MSKKRKQNTQSNYFLRTGVKLFRKAAGRSLDISRLVKSNFSKKSLAKHNWDIYSDPEFRETDAVTNEVTSMLLSMPGDSYYPEINPKNNERWLAMLGIKPQKPRFGYAGRLLLYYKYLFRAILSLIRIAKESLYQARQKKSFKGTPIYDEVNHLFSRSIANRYGHDEGRHRNPEKHGEDDTFQAKFVSREVKQDITQHNFATATDIDRIEMQEVFSQGMAIYRRVKKADQLVMRTNFLFATQGLSWDAAYRQFEPEYRKVGITTCRGAEKRRDTLLQRYPELKQIKDALEK